MSSWPQAFLLGRFRGGLRSLQQGREGGFSGLPITRPAHSSAPAGQHQRLLQKGSDIYHFKTGTQAALWKDQSPDLHLRICLGGHCESLLGSTLIFSAGRFRGSVRSCTETTRDEAPDGLASFKPGTRSRKHGRPKQGRAGWPEAQHGAQRLAQQGGPWPRSACGSWT